MITSENKPHYTTIDEYIELQDENYREKLYLLKNTIKSVVPDAIEVISYQMPAFKQNKVLVYFALNKKHIGFYPTGSGIKAFENELQDFKYSKGAIQFPHDKPLPIELITQIVQFRLDDVLHSKK